MDKMTELLKRYPELAPCGESIERALCMLLDAYRAGGKILLCGNGGSAADCGHITGELLKGFLLKRPVPAALADALGKDCPDGALIASKLQRGIPAISLPAQSEVLSAYANDVDPQLVYAQLVYAYARANDLFVGLSTSGNSQNVVYAAWVAKTLGLTTLALTGANASKLSAVCDCTIRVPETETYKVQELHLPVYHYLCAEAERILFAEDEQ